MENKNEKLLQIEDLHIHYMSEGRKVQAVNGVSFEINAGETIGLVGETGAGKTTMALAIMKLIQRPAGRYAGGKIVFNGEDLITATENRMHAIRGNQISMIFQDPMTSLNPVYTVGDQIAEVVALHQKVTAKQAMDRAGEVLELVGIPKERADEYPHQFSGGMKQRVCIAMALAANPQLLIADEPTTALDVTIQAQVLDLMGKLKRELNTAMILITHDLGIVSEVCDKVAIMYAGRIIEFGTLEDIYRNPSHPYTLGLFNSIPKLTEKIHRLTPIKGLMPDPTNLPQGCAFAPRCDHACEACLHTKPDTEMMNDTHAVACLRWRELHK
ncbi:MAG: ABC transporter ATP-binding protein [Clostridia bacterium]|nr:ABC transporter ATP-binding protein [Clostridia bacterium]